MANILITGATGFIGRGLCRHLATRGHYLLALVRPGHDTSAIAHELGCEVQVLPDNHDGMVRLLERSHTELTLHLATRYVAAHAPSDIEALHEANILLPLRILEAMKSAGLRKFVNTGTIFEAPAGNPDQPFNLYAATKMAAERLLAHYAHNEHFQVLTLWLSDTYGPADRRGKLLQQMIEAALRGSKLELSPGEQKISLTWTGDVHAAFAESVRRLLASDSSSNELFGACDPSLRSLRDIGDEIARLTNTTPSFLWGARPYRQNEIMLPTLPPPLPFWQVRQDFTEGLRQVIDGYQDL